MPTFLHAAIIRLEYLPLLEAGIAFSNVYVDGPPLPFLPPRFTVKEFEPGRLPQMKPGFVWLGLRQACVLDGMLHSALLPLALLV